MSRSGGGNVAKVSPGVYKKVLRVREAYPFDIACLLMRFFGSMLNIGVVTMITLSGYSFLTAGLSSSLIALSIFVVTPRVSKRIDERGQSAVVPKAAAVSLLGLVVLIANVALHGPVWPLFVGALLVGFFPSPQAMARARWAYLHPFRPLGRDSARSAYHVLLRERARRHGVHLQPVHLYRARCRHRAGGGHGVRRRRLCRRGRASVLGEGHRAVSRLVAG